MSTQKQQASPVSVTPFHPSNVAHISHLEWQLLNSSTAPGLVVFCKWQNDAENTLDNPVRVYSLFWLKESLHKLGLCSFPLHSLLIVELNVNTWRKIAKRMSVVALAVPWLYSALSALRCFRQQLQCVRACVCVLFYCLSLLYFFGFLPSAACPHSSLATDVVGILTYLHWPSGVWKTRMSCIWSYRLA